MGIGLFEIIGLLLGVGLIYIAYFVITEDFDIKNDGEDNDWWV